MQTATGEQKNDNRRNGRKGVTRRDGPPNTIDGFDKERRHPKYERYQVEHLARETQEDGLTGFANRSKEVSRDHLKTDDEHRRADNTHRFDGLGDEYRVMGEHARNYLRTTLAQKEDDTHHAGSVQRREVKRL